MYLKLGVLLLGPLLCLSSQPNQTASIYHFNFCTQSSPCSLGQGDCDSDKECEGRLTCGHTQESGKHGTNSCKEYNADAHPLADCCVPPLYDLPVSVPSVHPTTSKDTHNPADCLLPSAPAHGEWFCSKETRTSSTCSLECGTGYVPLGKSWVTCEGGVWSGEVSDMFCDEAAVLVAGGFRVDPFRMVSTVEVQFANGSKVRLPNHPAPQKKFSVTLVDGSIISCGDGKHYRHGRWDVVE